MMYPIENSHLVASVGPEAVSLLKEAARRHVAALFGDALESIAAMGKVQEVAQPMERAICIWVDLLLNFIGGQGYTDTYGTQDIRFWHGAARCWVEDQELACELFRSVLHPQDTQLPRVEVLEKSRHRANPPAPPFDYPWHIFTGVFRREVSRDEFLDPAMRERLRGLTDH